MDILRTGAKIGTKNRVRYEINHLREMLVRKNEVLGQRKAQIAMPV